MKKLKFLSVLLAVLTAFSCISAFSTFAAETKTISAVEITEAPNDIFTKSPDDLLYGLKIKISYSDNTSGTCEVTKDNIYESGTQDNTSETGLSQTVAIVSVDDSIGVFVNCLRFVGDYIEYQVSVMSSIDDMTECSKKIYYPKDYDLPEVFCKDYLVYKTNPDGTLTLINHNVFPPDLSTDEIVYPEIVIPEQIHGKTVTAIANYALLGYEHPSAVTIPATVTSVGEYAFGYCIDFHRCGDNHNIPDNVMDTRLAQKLVTAEENEKFIVKIYLSGSNPKMQGNRLKLMYFKDCTDYVYDSEEQEATATITKAQIYSMKDVEDISIQLVYSKTPSYVSDEVYDFSEYLNGGKIPSEISLYGESEEEMKAECKSMSQKYFGGRTNYTIDAELGYMYIDATLAELEKASDDELVFGIDVNTGGNVEYDLFKKMYKENDTYKTDIFVYNMFGLSPSESQYKAFAKKYFRGFKYEILMCENQRIMIVKGAAKRDVMTAGYEGDYQINTFSPPIMNNYPNIVIYGKNGSAAQTYAENNSIKFVATGSEYQLGDVNLDGKITVADATEILKANVDLVALTDEQKKLADFDGNGVVNVIDASELQRAIVNS
ncbi:MAG: dockerin type I repeat-containing protein [Ruminococcus sp.]|nr:dockerin type I repeat-containing protein [Ruminococcus sp.]